MDHFSVLTDYDVLEEIGQGAFGIVTKVRRKRDGHLFACKEVFYGKMSQKEKELLVQEVNILRGLQHPNIVRYVDRVLDRQSARIFIIQQLCSGGDLAAYIKRHRGNSHVRPVFLREEVIWNVCVQALLALDYCHSRRPPVLHRDLKPGNLFFTEDHRVKLGDFGLARTLSTGAMATTNVGTPLYMSPEQTKGLAYDEKSDIWSLGCIIYEMAALQPPFMARNQVELFAKIRVGKYAPLPSTYSQALQRLVASMLQMEPSARPSVSEMLRLPQIKMYSKEVRSMNREEEFSQREAAVAEKEAELQALEAQLREREADIARREAELARRLRAPRQESGYSPDFQMGQQLQNTLPL